MLARCTDSVYFNKDLFVFTKLVHVHKVLWFPVLYTPSNETGCLGFAVKIKKTNVTGCSYFPWSTVLYIKTRSVTVKDLIQKNEMQISFVLTPALWAVKNDSLALIQVPQKADEAVRTNRIVSHLNNNKSLDINFFATSQSLSIQSVFIVSFCPFLHPITF